MSKWLPIADSDQPFVDLADYIARTGKLKSFVATRELRIKDYELSRLLKRDMYDPVVTDELCQRIAELLQQPFDYVRPMYRAA
jgi:hypothetical protein